MLIECSLNCLQTLRVQSSTSEQEEVQVEVTRLLVECYFDIVRKNLQDAIPKAVMHFLVLFVQRGLQQRLIRSLYRSGSCASEILLCPYQGQNDTHCQGKKVITVERCHSLV